MHQYVSHITKRCTFECDSRIKKITNLTVGYSDHTEGSQALKYAIAMGAEILEFHFTDAEKEIF